MWFVVKRRNRARLIWLLDLKKSRRMLDSDKSRQDVSEEKSRIFQSESSTKIICLFFSVWEPDFELVKVLIHLCNTQSYHTPIDISITEIVHWGRGCTFRRKAPEKESFRLTSRKCINISLTADNCLVIWAMSLSELAKAISNFSRSTSRLIGFLIGVVLRALRLRKKRFSMEFFRRDDRSNFSRFQVETFSKSQTMNFNLFFFLIELLNEQNSLLLLFLREQIVRFRWKRETKST